MDNAVVFTISIDGLVFVVVAALIISLMYFGTKVIKYFLK